MIIVAMAGKLSFPRRTPVFWLFVYPE